MAKIAKLNVQLVANAKRFKTGIDTAKMSITRFSSYIRAQMPRIRNVLSTVFRNISLAAIAGAGALTYLAMRTAGATDEQIKLAKRLGLTYNRLKAIKIAAAEAGVSASELDTAFEKMLDTIGAARMGDKTALKNLQQIGISLRDLENMDPSQRLNAIADAINRIPDPADRLAAARDIFGRSGGALVNLFDNAGAKIRSAESFLTRMGLRLTEIDTSNIEKMQDSLGRSRTILIGLAEKFTAKLAPAIQEVSDRFQKWIQAQGGVDSIVNSGLKRMHEWLKKIFRFTDYIRAAFAQMAEVWGSIKGVWNDIPEPIKKVITFNPIRDAVVGDLQNKADSYQSERMGDVPGMTRMRMQGGGDGWTQVDRDLLRQLIKVSDGPRLAYAG